MNLVLISDLPNKLQGYVNGLIVCVIFMSILFVLEMLRRVFMRYPPEGCVGLVTGGKRPFIIRHGDIVVPFFHQIEFIKPRAYSLLVECAKENGLTTKDEQKIDFRCHFRLQIQMEYDDSILYAYEKFGSLKTLDKEKLETVFNLLFVSCAQTAALSFTFNEIMNDSGKFSHEFLTLLHFDFHGFVCDQIRIEFGLDDNRNSWAYF